MFNKKGSISISINMIVVVVLAFVMLGLMLTLGRNIVSSASAGAMDISGTTQQQIMEELQEGDKPLSFPKTKIEVGLGDTEILALGVKNTFAGDQCFKVELQAIDVNGEAVPVDNRKKIEMDYGYDDEGNVKTGAIGSFQFSQIGYAKLSASEATLVPIEYASKGAQKDTFGFQVFVYRADATDSGMCPGINDDGQLYASKSFFISVR